MYPICFCIFPFWVECLFSPGVELRTGNTFTWKITIFIIHINDRCLLLTYTIRILNSNSMSIGFTFWWKYVFHINMLGCIFRANKSWYINANNCMRKNPPIFSIRRVDQHNIWVTLIAQIITTTLKSITPLFREW